MGNFKAGPKDWLQVVLLLGGYVGTLYVLWSVLGWHTVAVVVGVVAGLGLLPVILFVLVHVAAGAEAVHDRASTDRRTGKVLGKFVADASGAILLVGIPIALPVAAWLLGWRTTSIVLGILSGIWLLFMLALWYVMSYEGRGHARMARQQKRMQEERDRIPIAERDRPL